MNYKALLCQLIEDLGGEIVFDKSLFNDHHIIHFYEDENSITVISEVKS